MRSQGLRAFLCISIVICTALISLRYYVRLRIIHNFGKDDWILIPLWLLMLFGGILIGIATSYGLGNHIYTLSDPQISKLQMFSFFASVDYLCIILVLKSSFILQFRRAFPLPCFHRICDVFLIVLCCWLVASIAAVFSICQPIAAQWNPVKLRTRKPCAARYQFWLANGILHLVTDVFIFLMPLPMIRGLPLPALQKCILGIVLCLGLFTCAISAVRLITLHNTFLTRDGSWSIATTIFWSLGELTCAVLCLCIPTFRPLIARQSRVQSVSNGTGSTEQSQQTPRMESSSAGVWTEAYHEALRERDICHPRDVP